MVNTIIMAYFTYNVHLKANENRSMSCMTYALHFTSLRIYYIYIYIEEHTHDMHTKWTLKITEKRQQKQQLWKKNPLNVVRMPPNFEFSCNSRVNKCKLNKYVCVKCRFGYSLCVFFFSLSNVSCCRVDFNIFSSVSELRILCAAPCYSHVEQITLPRDLFPFYSKDDSFSLILIVHTTLSICTYKYYFTSELTLQGPQCTFY